MPAGWEPDASGDPVWNSTEPEPSVGPDWGDSDGDGLPNWFEEWLGTSPGNPDSDYDGISDYDEIYLTYTNPLNWDSDGDGFSDHDAWYGCWAVNHNEVGFGVTVYDWDGDGLYNHEDQFPFDPNNDSGSGWMDSDGDGVDDGSDSHPWDSSLWNDWNYNGINDHEEDPSTGPTDSDGDGVEDDYDSHPWDSSLWNDWDLNGINDHEEVADPPDPYTTDSDGDGHLDAYDSHPWDSSLWNDYDYNAINDDEENEGEYDPTTEDSDGDGVFDAYDTHPLDPDLWSDHDDDGLNTEEELLLGTDPYDADTDDDGLTDSEEVERNTDPLNPDTDGDGLTDYEELRLQPSSHPRNAHSLSQEAGFGDLYTDWQMNDTTDTDGDGIPDRIEELYGRWLDPNNPHDAGWDADGDGVTNLAAYQSGWMIRADLNPLDRDGDGITDIQEDHWNSIHPGIFSKFRFSDAVADPDNDGLMNYAEIMQGSDPGVADSLYPGAGSICTGLTDLTVWAWTMTRAQIQADEPRTMITEWADSGITYGWFDEGDANGNSIPDGLEAFALANGVIGRADGGDFDGDGMSDVWEWRYRDALNPMDHHDAGIPGQVIPLPPSPPTSEDFSDPETGMVDDAAFSTAESDYQTALANYQAQGYHRIDPDNDGLCNLHEFQLRTHPLLADSDGDGLPDGLEVLHGGDPANGAILPPINLTLISAQSEQVEVGQTTAQPLKVGLTSAGFKLPNRWVTFTASGGTLLAPGTGPSRTVLTNSQGEAQIFWQAPTEADSVTVTATTPGTPTQVTFDLNAYLPALQMQIVGGLGQLIEIGKVAPQPISVSLTRGSLSTEGMWVTFEPIAGAGAVGASSAGPWFPSLTVQTNAQGQASAYLQASALAGNHGMQVTASASPSGTTPEASVTIPFSTTNSSGGNSGGTTPTNTGHRSNGLILFTSQRVIDGSFSGMSGTGETTEQGSPVSIENSGHFIYEEGPQSDGLDGDLDADANPDDPGDPRDENLQLLPPLRRPVEPDTPGAIYETWDEDATVHGPPTIAHFNMGNYNATNGIDRMKSDNTGFWHTSTTSGAFNPAILAGGLAPIKWGLEDAANGLSPGWHGWRGDGASGIVSKTAATTHYQGSVSGAILATDPDGVDEPWSMTMRAIYHRRLQVRVQSNRVITQEDGDQSVTFLVLQTTTPLLQDGSNGTPVIVVKGSVTFTIPVGEKVATEVEAMGEADQMVVAIPYIDLNTLAQGPPPQNSSISQVIQLIPPMAGPNEMIALSLLPLGLAVDANRDGTIAFGETASKAKPLRFWINNDTDLFQPDKEEESAGSDSQDYAITTYRDLEDFQLLQLNLPDTIIDNVKNGTWKLGFKWKNALGGAPVIRLYKVAPDIDELSDYLWNLDKAITQLELPYSDSIADVVGSQTAWLPADTLTGAGGSAAHPFLLFEGDQKGQGQLCMVIKIGSSEAEGPGVWIKLMDVQEMFENAQGTPGLPYPNPPDYLVNEPLRPDTDFERIEWVGRGSFQADPDETNEAIIMVHGWNMTDPDRRTFSESFFKRLWWKGYNGRFATFAWPTYNSDHDSLGFLPAHYNKSEYVAWKYGPALKAYVNSIPKGSKHVAAHSMGNVVMAAALKSGLSVGSYVAMEAALPAGCYDGSDEANNHADLRDANQARVTPDLAANLGYRGLMTGVSGNFHNFHSANDYALKTGVKFGMNVSWEGNQISYKYNWQLGYKHYPGATGSAKNRIETEFSENGATYTIGRNVIDHHEVMAFIARPLSSALGTLDTAGFTSNFDLKDESLRYPFGDIRTEHSGQYQRPIQKTHKFYNTLLQRMNVGFNDLDDSEL